MARWHKSLLAVPALALLAAAVAGISAEALKGDVEVQNEAKRYVAAQFMRTCAAQGEFQSTGRTRDPDSLEELGQYVGSKSATPNKIAADSPDAAAIRAVLSSDTVSCQYQMDRLYGALSDSGQSKVDFMRSLGYSLTKGSSGYSQMNAPSSSDLRNNITRKYLGGRNLSVNGWMPSQAGQAADDAAILSPEARFYLYRTALEATCTKTDAGSSGVAVTLYNDNGGVTAARYTGKGGGVCPAHTNLIKALDDASWAVHARYHNEVKAVMAKPFIDKICGPLRSSGAPADAIAGCEQEVSQSVSKCYPTSGITDANKENMARCMSTEAGLSAADATSLVDQGFGQASSEVKKSVLPPADPTAGTPNSGESTTTCSISGVGWIVCPVMMFLAYISDAAYGVIENFLSVNTRIMDTDTGTYEAWIVFRNIANAAFIVVFLIIIYSQITGAGLSSYGVKKMLPRLLVGAVLVNISFFITQLMVDVTQIMGATLKDLLTNLPASSGSNDPPVGWSDRMQGILTGVALGGAAIAGGAILLTSISGPVILAFVIAVLMTVVILIGRQAAIVMLVVLSPLAFVAYLLPNTESLFKKWLKTFWSLLLLYPIVALLYGGGNLAGRILNNAGASGTGVDSTWLQITALGVTAIPLIMTPFVLRGALNATGKLGAKLSGVAAGQQKAMLSKAKDSRGESRIAQYRKHRQNQSAIRRKRTQGGTYDGRNPLRKGMAAVNRRINQSGVSGEFGDRAMAQAMAFEDEIFEKNVKDASLTQNGLSSGHKLAIVTGAVGDFAKDEDGNIIKNSQGQAIRITNEQKTAAADSLMKEGGFGDRQKVLIHTIENGTQSDKARVVNQVYAKGDQDAYGTNLSSNVLEGKITSGAELHNNTLKNIAGGKVQAEHLVKSGAMTDYMSNVITESSLSTDPSIVATGAMADSKFKESARAARRSDATRSKVTGEIDHIFRSHGA